MILQSDVFWEDQKDPKTTVNAVKKYFHNATWLADQELMARKTLVPELFRGSLMMALKMGKQYSFANAMNWIPALGRHILEAETVRFAPMSWIEGEVHMGWDFSSTGFFARPCSPFKEFAGQVFTADTWKKEYSAALARGINPHIMCIVSSPVQIRNEYRCIFVNRKYTGGSRYMVDGELSVDAHVPAEVQEYAQHLANLPYFDNIFDFVIDIAEQWQFDEIYQLRLVEVNSFETASFYGADLDTIYKTWYDSLPEHQND